MFIIKVKQQKPEYIGFCCLRNITFEGLQSQSSFPNRSHPQNRHNASFGQHHLWNNEEQDGIPKARNTRRTVNNLFCCKKKYGILF